MLTKVRQTIARHGMLAPGERVLVAVSGGVDSIVLLHLLYELREELGIFLIVAHLDHRIRPESQADAEFVAAEAQRLGLPLVLEESDVPRYAEEHGLGPEEAAREVRYRFLEEAAAKVGADRIALGHQRDDLVETLLINLIRGAGLPGLRGMAPVRGRFIRPLIECSRAEIEAFAGKQRLEYRQDRTNLEKKYLRNRIRLELLPLLEDYRPNVAARLAQTAQVLGEAASYLERVAHERLEELVRPEDDDGLVLDRRRLLEEEPIIRTFILREAVRRSRGTLRDVEFVHLHKMSELIEGERSRAELHLPGRLRFRRDGERLSLTPLQQEVESEPYEFPLQMGDNPFPQLGWQFTLEEVEPLPKFDEDPLQELIDRDRIEEPLLIRNRRPGDRFRPLGMAGTKKLQDFFIDRKVPLEERDRIPLLCDRQGIVWVVGLRLSEDYKVTDKTKRALLLTARRLR